MEKERGTMMKALSLTKRIWIGIGLLIIIGILLFPKLHANIHTVIPGQVYRSAQLNPQQLQQLINKYHIKSVINLRGKSHANWYQQENHLLGKDNIPLYDLHLPAKALPSAQTFKQLVNILDSAPRPVLIHCKNGADRTGLASAIIVILDNHNSLATAKQQISWWYGAVSPQSIGRQVMPLYQAWLDQRQLDSNRANFLTWVNQLTVMGSEKTSPLQPTAIVPAAATP